MVMSEYYAMIGGRNECGKEIYQKAKESGYDFFKSPRELVCPSGTILRITKSERRTKLSFILARDSQQIEIDSKNLIKLISGLALSLV